MYASNLVTRGQGSSLDLEKWIWDSALPLISYFTLGKSLT